jgi:hypothetical protein
VHINRIDHTPNIALIAKPPICKCLPYTKSPLAYTTVLGRYILFVKPLVRVIASITCVGGGGG